ncbi:MAG: hypothetical protein ACI4OO_08775 [Otoolea sp.]
MKKQFCQLLALAMTTVLLTGCGTQTAVNEKKENEKEKVRVALWGT